MGVQKNEKPANFLTPRTLESLRTITIGSLQPTHWHCMRFKSARRQKVGWQSCPSIEPSVEHSKKPTSMLIRASFLFFWTPIRGHNGHGTRHQCSHVIKASQALSLPSLCTIISRKYDRAYKIKRRGRAWERGYTFSTSKVKLFTTVVHIK